MRLNVSSVVDAIPIDLYFIDVGLLSSDGT